MRREYYEVWDNITEAEVTELKGLFRHIYRKDTTVNRINQQRGFKKLRKVRNNTSTTGTTNVRASANR